MARFSTPAARLCLGLCATLGALGCASVEFTRETETSGRFFASGTALTIFGYDFPGGALQIARDNASDARQPNSEVTRQRIFPYLGPLDWLLDIISIRHARIYGTWGFAPGSGSDLYRGNSSKPGTAQAPQAGQSPAVSPTKPAANEPAPEGQRQAQFKAVWPTADDG